MIASSFHPPAAFISAVATSDQVYGCRKTVQRMAILHAVAVLKWHVQ